MEDLDHNLDAHIDSIESLPPAPVILPQLLTEGLVIEAIEKAGA